MNLFLYRIIFIVIFIPVILSTISNFINAQSEHSENSSIFIPASDSVKQITESENVSHGDKFSSTYLYLFFIIVGAVIGRLIARKINQPPVLGELLIGVIIGTVMFQLHSPIMTLIRYESNVNKIIQSNLTENMTLDEAIKKNLETASIPREDKIELTGIVKSPEFPHYNLTVESIFLLSNLGVLVLLFLVGLETSIEEMSSVGIQSLIVAVLGVVAPFALGYTVTMIFLPNHSFNLYLFMGATLCATSIGLSARVFQDLNRLNIPEARIVIGAAVIDDVLGLIVLAIVAGIISSGMLQISTIIIILIKVILFLGITLYVGTKFLRSQIRATSLIENMNISLLFPFALLLLLSWTSDQMGLASIVGAFTAGLIIKEEYFNEVTSNKNQTVKSVISPMETIFAPVFFVITGLQIDLSTFLNFNVLGIALILTLAAIIGKLISGIFAKGMNKTLIGIGMLPRGEVGLIFASIGKGIGILDSSLFSAIIIVVILTTFITPPGLKWALQKHDKSV